MSQATTSALITKAIVHAMRLNATLIAAIKGGIHEGLAPTLVPYPFIVYGLVTAPYEDDWSNQSNKVGRRIDAWVDISASAANPADANNVDVLIIQALDGVPLVVTGQTTLIVRRTADLPLPPEVDSEGKKVYRRGGTYNIQTAQDPTF